MNSGSVGKEDRFQFWIAVLEEGLAVELNGVLVPDFALFEAFVALVLEVLGNF